MNTEELKKFNEIYKRFCGNAVRGGFLVEIKDVDNGRKLITVTLSFEARTITRGSIIKPLSNEEIERKVDEVKKDHLASILQACGLLPGSEAPKITTCEWTVNDDGAFETACGNVFEFTADGPAQNGFKFCPYCGSQLGGFGHEQAR